MTTENGLQPSIGPLRRLSILSLRSRNSVHISQEELLLLDDCKRMVKDFNRRVASFKDALFSIGSADRDTTQLREELAKIRRQCVDLCRKAKTRMLPTVRSTTSEQNEQLYKYFHQFVACMQFFVNELQKSYLLIQSFPVQLPSDLTDSTAAESTSTAKTSQQSKDVPIICVGGERIQINISDPSNNEIAPDLDSPEEQQPVTPVVVNPAELEYPELGRIRRETQEVRDLLTDMADLIPKSPTQRETVKSPEGEASEDGATARKTKTKHRNSHRTSLAMCCTCKPDYM